MRSSLMVGVTLIALFVAGCSMFLKSIEKPGAEVRTVAVSSAGFTGIAGELALDVSNPNAFGVPLSGIEWQLSIGDARAVTGSVQLSQTIPARGVAPVRTSLTIQAQDAVAVSSLIARGARSYRLHARLTFSTQFGPLAVDLDHTGQLDGAAGLGTRLLGAR
ncbi:MAG: LEA type 2 family protein [Myxococcota bacterium]|nr:LEA type 2 family protein [Myxococcota bacterium]